VKLETPNEIFNACDAWLHDFADPRMSFIAASDAWRLVLRAFMDFAQGWSDSAMNVLAHQFETTHEQLERWSAGLVPNRETQKSVIEFIATLLIKSDALALVPERRKRTTEATHG
jgi:hypothetical protein